MMLQRVQIPDLVLPTRGSEKLDALTGLRFFAAAAIVLLHYQGSIGIPKVTNFALGQGVSFFFVLSGFVLAYVHPFVPTWRARWDFMVARIARVWPAHVAALALSLYLANLTAADIFNLNLLANLLLIQAWLPVEGVFASINGPSWSISTELGLYLAFLLLIGNFERNWRRNLLIAAVVTGSLVAAGLVLHLKWATASLPAVTVQSLIYQFPLGRLLEFVAGMCIAILFRRRPLPESIGTVAMTAIEVSILALIILNAAGAQVLVGKLQNPLTMYVGFSAVIPACLAIYVFAQERGLISQLLARRPIVVLGELSYAMYLLHVPVGRYFSHNKGPAMPELTALFFWLLCLLALSYFSWSMIEGPSRKLIRRAFTSRARL